MALQPLPPLPQRPGDRQWSPSVHHAYSFLVENFKHASRTLQEQTDPWRLRLAINLAVDQMFPALRAFEENSDQHNIPMPEDKDVEETPGVSTARTGKRGQPAKQIDPAMLSDLMSTTSNLKKTDIARALGVSRPTLDKELKKHNIKREYAPIRRKKLDKIVKTYRNAHSNAGRRYLTGNLLRLGLRVQRRRIEASITGLHASTNNKASTVLNVFLAATQEYGLPSRLRGDRGGENKKVSVYMIVMRGLGRGSFLWGSSTNNTRIERLWVEVGSHFVRQWRAFFYRLEDLHHLERRNPEHLWLLHQLFLDRINDDCDEFRAVWNLKPISGEGHNRSPEALLKLGQLQHGRYANASEYENDHPAVLQHYYGTHGPVQQRTQTGAGQLDDEEVSDADSDIEAYSDSDDENPHLNAAAIAESQRDEFNHKPVSVPKHSCPFDQDLDFQRFVQAIEQSTRKDLLPVGYGIRAEEWEDGIYAPYYIIKSGRKGSKRLRVDLPDEIWRPRSELWTRALAVLDHMISE
uniref:Integrase core domain-containing protein n=1 Tax=Mycena chlorophos TaxID=658473 RepID=A0ABQ0KUW4_MYCCL|nr:predicted protein [Mycena chlorophos]